MTDVTAIETVPIFDTIGSKVQYLPPGQAAGYPTGSGDVPWTTQQLADHPGVVEVDQTPADGEWSGLADVQDYEPLAVTLGELPGRIRAMDSAFVAGARPGQRRPAVYVGAQPNATPVVNELIAAGITGGVNLAIAAPGMSDADAISLIESTAATPWPIVWVQNVWGLLYNSGHASKPWLDDVSFKPDRRLVQVTLLFNDGTTEEFS